MNKEIINRELNEFNSEMLFANSVLLVEGISEKIIFRHLANNCLESDFNLDRNNISVIPVNGKENMKFYSELLECFCIPHIIVLDLDGLNETTNKILSNRKKSIPQHLKSKEEKIKFLKEEGIFILSKGEIEDYYPESLIIEKFKDNKDKIIKKLRSKKKEIVEESTLKIISKILISNAPILKPSSEKDLGRLTKDIKKWYDRCLTELRTSGKISLKTRKKYEILESIFGSIGKPRIALEVVQLINSPIDINLELLKIIEKVVEISKNSEKLFP